MAPPTELGLEWDPERYGVQLNPEPRTEPEPEPNRDPDRTRTSDRTGTSEPLNPWSSMDWLTDPQIWIALATLTFLEIVLGVDNVIFISILSGKLPPDQQPKARRLGLLGAMITRVLLLFSLAWIIRLTQPLFTIGQEISGRDLILIAGGLFLLGEHLRDSRQARRREGHGSAKVPASFTSVIIQIMLLDIVFSLDSVITAVGWWTSSGS